MPPTTCLPLSLPSIVSLDLNIVVIAPINLALLPPNRSYYSPFNTSYKSKHCPIAKLRSWHPGAHLQWCWKITHRVFFLGGGASDVLSRQTRVDAQHGHWKVGSTEGKASLTTHGYYFIMSCVSSVVYKFPHQYCMSQFSLLRNWGEPYVFLSSTRS